MAKSNVRLPKTLRPEYDLRCRYSTKQQFTAVLIKNFKLLSTAWCGLLASFLVPLVLIALLIYLHFYYVKTYEENNDGGNNDVITTSEYKILNNGGSLSQNIMGNVTYYVNPESASTDLGNIEPVCSLTNCKGYLGYLNSKYPSYRSNFSLKGEEYANYMAPFFTEVNCKKDDHTENCKNFIDQEIEDHEESLIRDFADLPADDDAASDDNTLKMITHHIHYKDIGFVKKGKGTVLSPATITVGQNVKMTVYLSNQTAVPLLSSSKTHFRLLSMQFLLNTLMMYQSTITIYGNGSKAPTPEINCAFGSYWTSHSDSKPDPYTPLFCMFFIPFGFLILIPIFTYSHSNDRGEGLNNLHFMMGLKYKNLFFGDYVYQLIICIAFSICVIIMCYFGQLEAISKNSPLVWLLDFLLFSLNVPIISNFIGCWFESGKSASIVSIVVVLVYSVCGVVAGSAFSGNDEVIDKSMHYGFSFIPGFSPIVIFVELCIIACMQDDYSYISYRDLHLITNVVDKEGNTRYISTKEYMGQSLTQNIIVGYFMTLFWGAFIFYLDQVVPRKHGVPEHWLFPFKGFVKRLDIVKKYLNIEKYVEFAQLENNADLNNVNEKIDIDANSKSDDGDDDDMDNFVNGHSNHMFSKKIDYITIPYSENDDSRGGILFTEEEQKIRKSVALEVIDREGLTLAIEKVNEHINDSRNYAILSFSNVIIAIGYFFAHPKLMTTKVNYISKFGIFLAIHAQQRVISEAASTSSNIPTDNSNVLSGELVDLKNDVTTITNNNAGLPIDEITGDYNYAVGGPTAALHGGLQLQQLFSEYSQTTSEYVGKNGIEGRSRYGKTRRALKNIRNAFSPNSIDEDVSVEKANTIACRLATNGGEPLVRIVGMKKTYRGTRTTPPKDAVKGIWLTVGENECLGLLGSNGAGKTTLLNMLCMSFKPTAGTGYINGYDITNPSSKSLIQSCLGVCPQFDIHWPSLSCAEHLKFFCRIKGVPKELEAQHVADLLNAVGLGSQGSVPSKSLSGGMRRRLSVAMSLCGKPKVLLLDEPSTGLDPENRRGLWNIILACRTGRATIITSHAMEEVVALCTRATITADGRLRCIGTIPHLQSKFGTGYQLGIHVDVASILTDKHTDEVIIYNYDVNDFSPLNIGSIVLTNPAEKYAHNDLISKIQGLKLISAYYGALTYAVPNQTKISDIFPIMESMVKQKNCGICDWSISQTSLESIFVRIVNESRI